MLAFCATLPPPVHPSTGALRRWAALPVPANYVAKTPRFRTPNMPKLMDDGRGPQLMEGGKTRRLGGVRQMRRIIGR